MILMTMNEIKGDSKISGYSDGTWFACTDFSFEITRELSDSAKAGTYDLNLGIAELPPISISKSLDLGSVDLFHQAINGVSSKDAQVCFVETVGDKTELYLKYELEAPVIVTWSLSCDEDNRPTEAATIWYNKIRMEYASRGPKKGDSVITHNRSWDRVKNTSWK